MAIYHDLKQIVSKWVEKENSNKRRKQPITKHQILYFDPIKQNKPNWNELRLVLLITYKTHQVSFTFEANMKKERLYSVSFQFIN